MNERWVETDKGEKTFATPGVKTENFENSPDLHQLLSQFSEDQTQGLELVLSNFGFEIESLVNIYETSSAEQQKYLIKLLSEAKELGYSSNYRNLAPDYKTRSSKLIKEFDAFLSQ